MNFSTFLRTLFLQNTSGRLLGHDVGHDVFGSVEVDCCNAYKNVTGYLLRLLVQNRQWKHQNNA